MIIIISYRVKYIHVSLLEKVDIEVILYSMNLIQILISIQSGGESAISIPHSYIHNLALSHIISQNYQGMTTDPC